MTEKDFRVLHSELIECYQNIEMRLKGICAAICADEDGNWFQRLDDYELDPLGKMIQEIYAIQDRDHLDLFSSEDYQALSALRQSRNYWVHQCFVSSDLRVVFKNGEVKRMDKAKKISEDLSDARDWEEKLTKIEHSRLKSMNRIYGVNAAF